MNIFENMTVVRWAKILLVIHMISIVSILGEFLTSQFYTILPPASELVKIASRVTNKASISLLSFIVSLIFHFYSKNIVTIIISGVAIIYWLL